MKRLDPNFVKQKLLELGATKEEIEANKVYLLFNQENNEYELVKDPDKLLIRTMN